jgi:hypothetical protein
MNYNPTNLERHAKDKHSQVDCPHIFNRKAKALQLKVEEKTKKICKSSIMAGVLTNDKTPEEALDEAQLQMYRFFNRAGVAIRQGSQAESHSLLSYCVNNSQYLKHQVKNLKIGQRKFASTQLKSFSKTIYVLRTVITSINSGIRKLSDAQAPAFSMLLTTSGSQRTMSL